jgi:hypothetical protein
MTCLAKLAIKESQHCRAPAVLTRLVSEAVDPHPRHRVPRCVREENRGKQVQDPCLAVVLNSGVVCKLRAPSKLSPELGD